MKAFFATLSALASLAVAWIVITLILYVIGAVGSQACPGLGFIHLIHIFLMGALSPGIGGFFAIHLTSIVFRAVDLKTLYVSFVSVVAVIMALLFLVALISLSSGRRSIGELIMFLLQAAAMFLGAWVGRLFASERRSTEGA